MGRMRWKPMPPGDFAAPRDWLFVCGAGILLASGWILRTGSRIRPGPKRISRPFISGVAPMERLLLRVCLLLVAGWSPLLLGGINRLSAEEPSGKKVALLVGVNQYDRRNF